MDDGYVIYLPFVGGTDPFVKGQPIFFDGHLWFIQDRTETHVVLMRDLPCMLGQDVFVTREQRTVKVLEKNF